FSTKSGNPELHSGLPCGTAPACCLHLPYPLRSHDVSPAASPAISSGRCRHPASVSCPCDVGTYGRRRPPAAGNLKILKNVIFFFFYIFHMLCPVPCLHFVCSF
ncbi:unnamed protein product, partial [Staurois parvus]